MHNVERSRSTVRTEMETGAFSKLSTLEPVFRHSKRHYRVNEKPEGNRSLPFSPENVVVWTGPWSVFLKPVWTFRRFFVFHASQAGHHPCFCGQTGRPHIYFWQWVTVISSGPLWLRTDWNFCIFTVGVLTMMMMMTMLAMAMAHLYCEMDTRLMIPDLSIFCTLWWIWVQDRSDYMFLSSFPVIISMQPRKLKRPFYFIIFFAHLI